MDLDSEETMLKEKGIYATGGLIGAVLASTCCIVPFVFLLLGISGAWISYLTVLAPYQPIFLVMSLGFLEWDFGRSTETPKPIAKKVLHAPLRNLSVWSKWHFGQPRS